MKRMTFLLAALLCVAMAAPSPSEGGIGIGVRGGMLVDDQDTRSIGGFVRLRSGFFGLEAAWDRWNVETLGGADIDTSPLTFGLMAYPLPWVYAIGGLGLYDDSIGDPGPESFFDEDDDVGWQLGGGVEIPVLPIVSVTGDVRWTFLDREVNEFGGLSLDDSNWVAAYVGAAFMLPTAGMHADDDLDEAER